MRVGASYLVKLKGGRTGEIPADEAALIKRFELLNELEWAALLEDVVREKPSAFTVFQPSRGEDLLSYASTWFEALPPAIKTVAAQALDRFLTKALREKATAMAEGCLFIAASVATRPLASTLQRVVLDRNIEPSLREKAADVLAADPGSVPQSFWDAINLAENPVLAVSVFTAVSQVSLLEAFRKLLNCRAPADPAAFEYPLRSSLRRLASSGGLTELSDIYDSFPSWLQSEVVRVLAFEEFSAVYSPIQQPASQLLPSFSKPDAVAARPPTAPVQSSYTSEEASAHQALRHLMHCAYFDGGTIRRCGNREKAV